MTTGGSSRIELSPVALFSRHVASNIYFHDWLSSCTVSLF